MSQCLTVNKLKLYKPCEKAKKGVWFFLSDHCDNFAWRFVVLTLDCLLSSLKPRNNLHDLCSSIWTPFLLSVTISPAFYHVSVTCGFNDLLHATVNKTKLWSLFFLLDKKNYVSFCVSFSSPFFIKHSTGINFCAFFIGNLFLNYIFSAGDAFRPDLYIFSKKCLNILSVSHSLYLIR